jgi:excisionase family DNA binding protein
MKDDNSRGGRVASAPELAGSKSRPSELECARMRRILATSPRAARNDARLEPPAAAVLVELRCVRSELAGIRDLLLDNADVRGASMSGHNEVLTRVQVAELLSVCVESVSKLVRDEGLPCKRVGKEYRFLRSDVLGWLRERDLRTVGEV